VIALSNLKTTFHIDVRSIKYSVDDWSFRILSLRLRGNPWR
jgi:hypothetical protein